MIVYYVIKVESKYKYIFIKFFFYVGDCFSHAELVKVLKCLKNAKDVQGIDDDNSSEDETAVQVNTERNDILTTGLEKETEELKELIPEVRIYF